MAASVFEVSPEESGSTLSRDAHAWINAKNVSKISVTTDDITWTCAVVCNSGDAVLSHFATEADALAHAAVCVQRVEDAK
jgi:hypothetical protein